MSEESSEDASSHDDIYIPYKDRPDWKDIQPLAQDDGPNPVVQIAYSEHFREVYDYFRAIVAKGEMSERALKLTEEAAELNPANYSVWNYRRHIIRELDKDLGEELQYVSQIIEDNPKNYQVWHHRSVLVEWKNDPSKELSFTEKILRDDAKNYHAWQHRQWCVQHFSLWGGELDLVEKLLQDDLRNNSAWNQRYFVINGTTGFTPDVINKELSYVQAYIQKAPNNESAWNYMKGILIGNKISDYPSVMDFCLQLYSVSVRSPFLIACLVDCYEEFLELGKENVPDNLKKATQLCSELADHYDTIRSEYWKYISRSIVSKYGGEVTSGDS